ncbi:hypothetical protein BKA70DRAFT_334487 [Coprinopsis sp. MPI-PUGE-AT-0042]|nr:hypothetical protein BKA70DRAFT_334487 [Coprinopsis sp. MPI-PUGE-AT-0042]
MSVKGTKRASPGADEGKKNPLSVEINEQEAKKLEAIQRIQSKLDLALERDALAKLYPVYEKRRAIVKEIKNFWPVALMNNHLFAFHVQHSADQTALSFLEDVWVTRDSVDHRCFTVEFFFKENQYFSNTVLKKEFKYSPPASTEDDKADENGITDAMLHFDWSEHVKISSMKIDWKSDENNLTKHYPRQKDEDDEDDDELPQEPGSFFNFFEHKEDPYDVSSVCTLSCSVLDPNCVQIGLAIGDEVFRNAIDFFLGNADDDSDLDEDSEDDDDDAEEIDLEKPRPKKRKF